MEYYFVPIDHIISKTTSTSLYMLISLLVDGDYCITCGSDKSVKLWNPYRGTLLKTYSGHGYEVLDARCSCDSR